MSEVSRSAVEKTCGSSAAHFVLLTTHGTANETICEVSIRTAAHFTLMSTSIHLKCI